MISWNPISTWHMLIWMYDHATFKDIIWIKINLLCGIWYFSGLRSLAYYNNCYYCGSVGNTFNLENYTKEFSTSWDIYCFSKKCLTILSLITLNEKKSSGIKTNAKPWKLRDICMHKQTSSLCGTMLAACLLDHWEQIIVEFNQNTTIFFQQNYFEYVCSMADIFFSASVLKLHIWAFIILKLKLHLP